MAVAAVMGPGVSLPCICSPLSYYSCLNPAPLHSLDGAGGSVFEASPTSITAKGKEQQQVREGVKRGRRGHDVPLSIKRKGGGEQV